MLIKPNDIVLFQGDSVTDAGRDRENGDALGTGYPLYVDALFQEKYPTHHVRFYNRGIGGNRVGDLVERWTRDALDLKPDVLSILVGINDVWRNPETNLSVPTEETYENYRRLLERTRDALGDIPIVMMEPFILPGQSETRAVLDPKIQAIRKLAREFAAVYIPLDGIFAAACVAVPHTHWSADGIHPTSAGHMLIAKRWLDAVGA